MFSIESEAEFLRKLMTKITMKDVLSKVKVREQIMLNPIRHTRYDLTLNLLPHRCYESITHVKPKSVMKFIRYKLSENLRKMFLKNLSKNFSGKLVSEETRRMIKINKEIKDQIDEDILIVRIFSYNLQFLLF